MPININVPNLPYANIENPQIDFSSLANLGTIPERLRMRDLRNKFQRGEITDYDSMWKELGKADPVLAAKLMQTAESGADKYGLNPIVTEGPDGKPALFQAYSGGGVRPIELPQGYSATQPLRYVETSQGLVPVGTRVPGAVTGGAPTPRQVQTESYAMGPDGQPVQAPNTIPSLAADKHNLKVRESQINDQQSIADFDQSIAQMENNLAQVTSGGKPTEDLNAVAGAYEYGPVSVPKEWVPTTKTGSAKAENAVKTFGVQVGLQTLAKMRAQSAQGASGMGQLAIQESQWLQNSVRALTLAQKPEDVVTAMNDVLYFSKLVSQRLKAGYAQIYGTQPSLTNVDGGTPPSQQQPQPVSGGANDDPLGLF